MQPQLKHVISCMILWFSQQFRGKKSHYLSVGYSSSHLSCVTCTKTLHLCLHRSDSLLSSSSHSQQEIIITELGYVFTIAEFGHHWWKISQQCVLTERSISVDILSLSVSLCLSLRSFSSFQMGTMAEGKPLWSLGPQTVRQICRIMGV